MLFERWDDANLLVDGPSWEKEASGSVSRGSWVYSTFNYV